LYLWNNERREKNKQIAQAKQAEAKAASPIYVPKLSQSKLHELAWSLDIKEKIAAGIASDADREGVAPGASIVAPIRTARSALVK